MLAGWADRVGSGNSVTAPAVVILPILLPLYSVNHSFLSGPVVMNNGRLPGVGTGQSVIAPAGVMRPIRLADENSVNQMLPSEPDVTPTGSPGTPKAK